MANVAILYGFEGKAYGVAAQKAVFGAVGLQQYLTRNCRS